MENPEPAYGQGKEGEELGTYKDNFASGNASAYGAANGMGNMIGGHTTSVMAGFLTSPAPNTGLRQK